MGIVKEKKENKNTRGFEKKKMKARLFIATLK